jgi:hypothetical protein
MMVYKHSLDDLIKDLSLVLEGKKDPEMSIYRMIYWLAQEIKDTDYHLNSLSDEINGYDP